MAEINYIKHQYEKNGKSLRTIAKETGMDFRTVKKYAHKEDFNKPNLPNLHPQSYPTLGPYIEIINQWLLTDATNPRKQRHTKTRIYNRLATEHGYTGSYSSVKRYITKAKELINKNQPQLLETSTTPTTPNNPGFLPLAHPKGHAQIDFGNFSYTNNLNETKTAHALIVSFPASNAGWMQVFPAENQECLLQGLSNIFYHIGGTPKSIKADNMATAVAHIPTKGKERKLTEGFLRFMLHFRFEAEFCNPDSANEKGNVENKVGYSRRNMLVPIPTITNFAAYNKELLTRCDADHQRPHYKHQETISNLWEAEKQHLLTLPTHEYSIFRYESLAVNKCGFVSIDTNKYGISPEYFGKLIQAKIFCDTVELYYDHNLLQSYPRSYSKHQEVMAWQNYLPTLLRKPGGLEHTRFHEQIPKLWRDHLTGTQGKERKNALTILSDIVRDGNEEFCEEILGLARECGRTDSDSIRQCYHLICKLEPHPAPLQLTGASPQLYYKPDLGVYDALSAAVVSNANLDVANLDVAINPGLEVVRNVQ